MFKTQNPGAEGSVSDQMRTVYLFLVLRMIVSALVVGAGITIIQVTHETFPVRSLYLLLALSVVFGAIAYAAFKAGAPFRIGLWSIMVVDILLEGIIVHYSGGIGSQFSMIYCLTIVAAAFLLEMPGGVATAILASTLYITYGISESIGWVHPPGADALAETGSRLGVLQTYMHVSLFFLVGAGGGFLSSRMKAKGRLLDDAENKLQQLKVDTDYILRHMSSGILVVDSEGELVTINPAAEIILGVTEAEVAANGVEKSIGINAPALARELRDALSVGNEKLRHEIVIESTAGKKIPLGTSISLIRDPDGETRGVISVFQDLTEVQEMREQVRRADRLAAIGELSAGIAHELRNPLASISGSIELLSGELKLVGENQRLMELILRESDRLDAIINDFLDFARLRFPARRPISVATCIDEVLFLLKNNQGKTKNIELRLEVPVKMPVIRADDEQLRQVFLNIAVNSCEAMQDGGTLDVSVRDEGDNVSISFRDDGPGIDPEEVDHLFEPFFTTKENGTGLGLAIANKIVTAHDGKIDFRNHEDGGAEFMIVLPIAPVEMTDKKSAENHELTHITN